MIFMRNGNGAKHERREVSIKRLNKVLKAASTAARREMHARGLPITIWEDGAVVDVFPDGTKTIVVPIDSQPVPPRKFKLK